MNRTESPDFCTDCDGSLNSITMRHILIGEYILSVQKVLCTEVLVTAVHDTYIHLPFTP